MKVCEKRLTSGLSNPVCVEPAEKFASYLPASWTELRPEEANRCYPALRRNVDVEDCGGMGRGVVATATLRPGACSGTFVRLSC
jgi:hypothetical protein